MSPLVIVLLTVVAAKVLPLEWLHVDLTRFYHYLGRRTKKYLHFEEKGAILQAIAMRETDPVLCRIQRDAH